MVWTLQTQTRRRFLRITIVKLPTYKLFLTELHNWMLKLKIELPSAKNFPTILTILVSMEHHCYKSLTAVVQHWIVLRLKPIKWDLWLMLAKSILRRMTFVLTWRTPSYPTRTRDHLWIEFNSIQMLIFSRVKLEISMLFSEVEVTNWQVREAS